MRVFSDVIRYDGLMLGEGEPYSSVTSIFIKRSPRKDTATPRACPVRPDSGWRDEPGSLGRPRPADDSQKLRGKGFFPRAVTESRALLTPGVSVVVAVLFFYFWPPEL